MTTATRERLRLDKFLQGYGSGIGTLVRVIGTTNQTTYPVDVHAHVRLYLANELNEMIIQGDSRVIISSTEIIDQQWPNSPPPFDGSGPDPRVPRRGDKFIWEGKTRNIEASDPIYFVDDQLIRIQLQVRG